MVSSRIPLLLVGLAAACQVPVAPPAVPASPVDAAWPGATSSEPPAPRVLDDVVAELLRAAAAALAVEQRVRCENIANVDTPGYRRRIVERSSTQIVGEDGESFTVPTVTEASVRRVFSGGTLEITERGLDIAIDGEGFLAVVLPDGAVGYTRDGHLALNPDGKLVTGHGEVLLPEITVPGDTLEISVDPTGLVSGRTAGNPDGATRFGQLTLSRFVNPSGLRVEGHVFRPTEDSGSPLTGQPGLSGLGLVKQGFVERSNVDLAKELLALQLLEGRRDALLRVMRRYGIEMP